MNSTNPWHVIGWIVLILISIPIAFVGFTIVLVVINKLSGLCSRRISYFRTRNIPPKKGQCWNQDGSILEIGQRYPKGHFNIQTQNFGSKASWGETDEEWRVRVRNRKLFLVSDPSVPGAPSSDTASSKPE